MTKASTTTEHPVTALFVAHPGHEVRIHGWLELSRPRIFILTDGSGRSGKSRIDSTLGYLSRLGAERGSVFGRFTDHEVYRAILAHDFEFFTGICDELAERFVEAGIHRVVGDAAEGYNTAHDVCRLTLNAAAIRVEQATGDRIENYDFPVVGRPDDCPARLRDRALWLNLDNETFRRKLDAAREFYPELAAEVDDAVHGRGESPLKSFLEREGKDPGVRENAGLDSFRVECLRPAGDDDCAGFDGLPFYEIHSERQVAAGHYDRVIRYEEHMRPLAVALDAHAKGLKSSGTRP